MLRNTQRSTHPNTAHKHRQWCGGGGGGVEGRSKNGYEGLDLNTAVIRYGKEQGFAQSKHSKPQRIHKRQFPALMTPMAAWLATFAIIFTVVHTQQSGSGSFGIGVGATASTNVVMGAQGEIEFNSLDGGNEIVTQFQPTPKIRATETPQVTIGDIQDNINNNDNNDINNNFNGNGVMSSSSSSTSSLPPPPSSSYTELKGGEIVGERVLRRNESPFLVRENIFVPKNGKLTIEAGVTMEFAPTVGIIVQGILEAVGQPTARITLTAQTHLTSEHLNLELTDAEERGARLVDGPTPLEGRLELYHKGSWRDVCSNSRNWTLSDYGVLCRQLGYRGGRFWNWVERRAGYRPRLLYEQPQCLGTERSLTECSNWASRQLGAGVCDYHNDIGVQCQAAFAQPTGHWRGIQFDNVPAVKSLGRDNIVYTAQSQSTLRYVDIIHAGAGTDYAMKPAVEVLGLPPVVQHVVVSHSAHTGINVTRPGGGFSMQNVTVRRSNGIGIFVNSSQGLVQLEGCTVLDNGADGIKYVGHDLRADERNDRSSIYDFCTLPTTSGQTYPITLSFTQKFYAGAPKECGKYFFTRPGYLLTVHFEYFVLRNNGTLTVDIFDGASVSDRLLFTWQARNYTRPQSVTSTREKLFIRLRADQREEVNGFIRLTTGDVSAYDLRVVDSTIEDNDGRGIAIDNIRSKLHVHRSIVSGNGHISGVHVTSGAGDVNITQSNISFNHGDGINITYYGGNRNISRSTIASNKGYGVAVWLNETTAPDRIEYITFNQTTVVEYSQLHSNVEIGVRHGNFCEPIWVNITGNHFDDGNSDDVYIESCWQYTNTNYSNLQLQIGHNLFENSRRNAIYMSPALNLVGRIKFNQFRLGQHGAIFIRNDFIFEEFNFLPVRIIIQSNYFMRNRGLYVVSLGLSPFSRSEVQSLLFTRNFVKENKISEPFGPPVDGSEGQEGAGRLNPRSRVAAAVVVGSSSVDIFRNILHNHDSAYEIGSQLSDQSQIINATYNWLGSAEENKIFSRLFHRNDRYNLAKIEYIPYLLHNSNPGTTAIIAISTLVPRFFHENSETIGGEVDGQETIPAGIYTVTKDINIRPGGKLILQPGVTLKFEPSVGMMVAGMLEARGRRPDDIFFTLRREPIIGGEEGGNTTMTKDAENFDGDAIEIETESILEGREAAPPKIPVRLVGGAGSFEGRLQIYLEGRWGTVCDYGWNVLNAALVCHHLGYTLNPTDWRLLRSQMPNVGITEDVIASNVRCTEQDLDITKCRAEHLSRNEFENSCTHDNDVGVRCYEGAWAGVRFSMLSERANLQYVTIEKAGLFDYTTNALKPAIQMDFARHNLENVRVVNNLNDGLGVIYSDIYAGKSVNNVKNSEFTNNRGNGISLKQLDLLIQGSVIKGNHGSGISHDPVISAIDQQELGGWFRMSQDFNTFEMSYDPYPLPHGEGNIDIGTWESKYIRTEEHRGESITRTLEVHCPAGYVLGIQLLNPIQTHSTERITIYDSQTQNARSDIWVVNRDLNVFPTTSSSYGIILHYESGSYALGGTVLMFSTVAAPVQNARNKIVRGPIPSLHIRTTKIQNNLRGISAFYYNRYYGSQGEYYLRKANESIKIVLSEISHNEREAMLIKAPFWDVINSNLSEVSIHVNNSMISLNGHGIRQVSKDLRSSNNLFHYVIQDTTVENNANGGFDVQLPYVWQYNINFTHSVYFGSTTWQRNRNFYIDVRGHYAIFNISSNVFIDNRCGRGLISLGGMEKCLRFDYNRIENNTARFIMEFKANSLSEIIGQVPALVAFNTIKGNRFENANSNYRTHSSLRRRKGHAFLTENRIPTAVIRLDGVQNVRLYRNLIAENEMVFNLVAGVRSACLNNFFYATENWWGTEDPRLIESKIFDFDNWNDHADVLFQPYLIEDSFDGSMSLVSKRDDQIDLVTWTGGRIYKDFTLKRRAEPYVIMNDITIMPGVTLTVQHGVQLEFEPNVGILVLGTLTAIGYRESPIVMRPFYNTSREALTMYTRRRRSMEHLEQIQSYDSIRLCTNSQNCSSESGVFGSSISEGFLEYFNHTTLQWVPICDRRFTERNAQVVCRELGYDPLNVYYGHDRRIEFHTNSLTRIWSWVQPLECRGDEQRMEECAERLNGQLYGHRHECRWDDAFVFVSCLTEPDDQVYWGGIRFANSEFEENQFQSRFHDTNTHAPLQSKRSQLEFVRIEYAGILHNQKSAAIQTVYKNPIISAVSIVNSAHHGVNLIAPSGTVNLNFLNITNAFGTGISILSLTGEGRDSDESSYMPLKSLDMPYKLFSMVDICDPQKVLTVEERVLVYYKYDNKPVNCVKIFTAARKAKPMGFRLLQSNLFNHSKEYGRSDTIRLFDGDIYNVTSRFMGAIESDSNNQRTFFNTTSPTLSLQLIASGAPEHHGFIAEVVTIPISTISQYRDALHNITYSHVSGCIKGAVTYSSAGEITPTLTLSSNRVENNCRQLYGNFSTCPSALNLDVQNMHSLFFMNNLLMDNQGGLRLRADSRSTATSLRGFIHHNLFTRNRNRPALYIEGRQSSPYQEIELYRNYFAQNRAGFDDVIRLRQVVSNFSYNYVHSNVGGRIVEVSGFEKVRLPIYQTTSHNGFYRNVATNWMGRATIVAGTAGQQYVDNIFENPDNDYEMITVNNSIFTIDFWNSTIELWRSKIDARHNYWSYNNTISVQSRIRDKSDNPILLEVESVPFQMNNFTILDGKCPPGWALVQDTCFTYVGAPMTFNEAREFCRSENSSMPFIRTDSNTLWVYLQSQMLHLKYPEKVWIQDFNYIDRCTSFQSGTTEIEDCQKQYGFICEIDPKVAIDPLSWRADVFAISIISALILAIILLMLVAFCWYAKSKHRQVQRLQRRNSIRQSLRSLNSIDPQGSLRRRNFNVSSSNGTLTKNIAQDYKKMMMGSGDGSIDSINKSVLSSDGSFEAYDQQTEPHQSEYQQRTPQRYNEYVNHMVLKPSNAGDSPKVATIGSASKGTASRVKAAAAALAYEQQLQQHPDTFELSYRNEGFRDNSTFSGTRNNSISTSVTEDTPIIHQTDIEDGGSDYYGNASTLPLHNGRNESLSFLADMKQAYPAGFGAPHEQQTHTSFLPQHSNSSRNDSTLPYEQKIDHINFSPMMPPPPLPPTISRLKAEPQDDSLYRKDNTMDMRRPDSYYTAVRSSKAQPTNKYAPTTAVAKHEMLSNNNNNNNNHSKRPKTVYQTANEESKPSVRNSAISYHRSKSEALLETDFDTDPGVTNISPLQSSSRSYSQPLETAM